jgi:phenylacetate-CoA ligase
VAVKVQARRLRTTAAYVYRHSPFYRELFHRDGLHPNDLRTPLDLRKLPFTTSKELRNWHRFLCLPAEDEAAVFTTSGTTGEPKRVFFSHRDMQVLTNFAALFLRIRHPGRLVAVVAMPMNHGMWIGSATAERVVERAGGLSLPVGADDPRETLKWMRRFEPNVLMSSPSYVTILTRQAEQSGYRTKLEKIFLGGEVTTPDHKSRFHDYWGAEVYDSYGSTEIGGGQTLSTPDCSAFHLNDLHFLTEIVDSTTGEPAEEGELVFTTLMREAMPLVRYRSGDRARWAKCSCGLPFSAIQLAGRSDDMMVVGDMNLFGNVIAEAVGKVPGASGRVEIRVDKVELTDRMTLRVEGNDVGVEAVRQALFAAYPELPTNIDNGNLMLEIEPDVALGQQIKTLRIVDRRVNLQG